MAWQIEFSATALKGLAKLDRPVEKRIRDFLRGRLAELDNPRNLGEALQGTELGEFWKYRVGDYRIIAKIHDETVSILVIKIGNRREVYR